MAKWVETIWGPAPALKRPRRARPVAHGLAQAGATETETEIATAGRPTAGGASPAAAPKPRSPKKVRREPGQLSLAEVKTWGGRRAGAGRKRGLRPPVPHTTRPKHRRAHPVHVTMRRAKGLPSFRTEVLRLLIVRAMEDTRSVRGEGFRIVHYSIQGDHLHLIVEADEQAELSNGMRSFAIRIALRINRQLARKRGKVWGDRHHRRDLTTPSEVRNALVYLLSNHLKHGETDVGLVDPCSSGPWFQGWIHGFDPPPEPSVTTRATTWLLGKGWETRGLIHRGEVPKSLRAPR